jgi:hypothetical protein
MMLKRFLPYSAAIAVAFLPGLLRADIVVDSQGGLVASLCGPAPSLSCAPVAGTVAITEDSAWQQIPVTNPGTPSDTSAIWIGAVASGYGDSVFVPQDLVGPAYEITSQTFTGSTLLLDVWADDSVDVFLNNLTTPGSVEISPASTINQASACSGQEVSCTPPTEGVFTNSLIAGDTYDLQFNVWQTGSGTDHFSNPTGLLYSGTAIAPEPGAVTLLVTMLMAVAGFAGILKKKLA